jgi:hypothetical protein
MFPLPPGEIQLNALEIFGCLRSPAQLMSIREMDESCAEPPGQISARCQAKDPPVGGAFDGQL